MTGEWVVRAPHPALRRLVPRYVGYTRSPAEPVTHRGLPGGYVTLVVSLDEPIRLLGTPRPGQAPVAARGSVAGLRLSSVLVAQERGQSGVHVDLHPLGVRWLLGVSAGELAGEVVDLADLASPRLAALPDLLSGARDWRRRFDLLDSVLLGGGLPGGGPPGGGPPGGGGPPCDGWGGGAGRTGGALCGGGGVG